MSMCPRFFVQMVSSEAFATKRGIGLMVHDYKLECHVKCLDCYFQGQGHSEGLHLSKKITVCPISICPITVCHMHLQPTWYGGALS